LGEPTSWERLNRNFWRGCRRATKAPSPTGEHVRRKDQQLAFRYLRNKEDAEEVMQDVLQGVRNVGVSR
jgi:hypothetical protein